QLASGLYGAIVVLEPGTTWNPVTDHVLLFSQRGRGDSAIDVLGGGNPADTLVLRANVTHRLRFVNIVVQDDIDARIHRSSDTVAVDWHVIAKDGMTLPKRRI